MFEYLKNNFVKRKIILLLHHKPLKKKNEKIDCNCRSRFNNDVLHKRKL